MKINHTDFSFEESLRFLEEDVASQLGDGEPIAICDTLTEADLLPKQVTSANCTAMYVKVIYKSVRSVKYKECAYHAAMNLILKIVQSTETLRLLNIQADGGLLAVFDTPMKKQIEEVINLSAMIRSVNAVVLTTLKQDLSSQVVTVGLDYGAVLCFNNAKDSLEEKFFAGDAMLTAKQLTDLKEDYVVISNSIYINLSEDWQKNLFVSHDIVENNKYHFAPLINIRMHKWVTEQLKG